eukprot:767989-Hanusia_phi.AAC.4
MAHHPAESRAAPEGQILEAPSGQTSAEIVTSESQPPGPTFMISKSGAGNSGTIGEVLDDSNCHSAIVGQQPGET